MCNLNPCLQYTCSLVCNVLDFLFLGNLFQDINRMNSDVADCFTSIPWSNNYTKMVLLFGKKGFSGFLEMFVLHNSIRRVSVIYFFIRFFQGFMQFLSCLLCRFRFELVGCFSWRLHDPDWSG